MRHALGTMFTPSEVAGMLRRSDGWVYKRIKSGEIKAYRMRGQYLIKEADVAAYLLSCEKGT